MCDHENNTEMFSTFDYGWVMNALWQKQIINFIALWTVSLKKKL